ncbi:hypothetical protein [Flavobacterium caseinilyticum]|uniref:Uncharacterized protein n=1 Tax=Flavobacterium caseinilyticum TaxID=2541732 RepID=A0A4R5ASR5_9FLAO|nr:hypothetical protein [Flavobacterium caseinilyticum]TDD74869.1 hypothetical protein E0F89_13235 [Flavobacterium caseinilyticum]
MDTNKKNKTILDRLDKVELELLQHDTEYAKQFLMEEGIDPDKEIEFSGQFMKKIRFMALGMSNKQRDLKLLDVAFDRLKEVLKENSERASEALINLLHTKTPAIHYRKLESWSDDEIRDVLSDVDLIQLIEELKK